MLDLFRKRGVMSVVYSALMGAVIVVFVIQFRPNSNSPIAGLTRKCVAKVRGTCIDERDWRAQRYLLRGSNEQAPSLNWNKVAADSLIERSLLEQEAKRLGVRVTEDDVMQEIIRDKVHVMVPVAMRAQARNLGINDLGFRWMQFGTKEKPFDQMMFEKLVRNMTGQNAGEFIDTQMQELVAARMLALVAERVRVSDTEAWDQYQFEKATTTLQYVRFQPAYFAEHFAKLDPATVEKWAADHASAVEQREKTLPVGKQRVLLHPRHILIEAKKDATNDQKAAAKKKADELLERVKAGEDFAKLAKDNSSDPGSKDKGGEYDWTTGEEYVPEFRDGLLKLKPGEASVVETTFGFHVIQLMARFDGPSAVAFPMYRDERGGELAKEAAEKVAAAVKGKIPVAIDDALKAKIEDAKKGGKNEADATAQVVADETKARLTKAIDETLAAMAPPAPPAPKPAAPKPTEKKDEKKDPKKDEKKDEKPVEVVPKWRTDDRRPLAGETMAFSVNGTPIPGFDDAGAIGKEAEKLTKEAPFVGPIKAGTEQLLLVLREKKAAVRADFDKDKANYVGAIVAKKREDAIVNYVTSLRESAGKEVTIEQKYVADEKKGPGEAPVAPPVDMDDPQ